MKQLFLAIFLIQSSILAAQAFQIGEVHITLTDPDRGGREIPLEVFYPLDSLEKETEMNHEEKNAFPVICFAHGYLMKPSSYQHISSMLVPHGFILVFPATETEMFPSHQDYAADIRFISRAFPLLSQDPQSIFYEGMDSSFALMGHSMGGGCSVLAAENNPAVDALVTLAAFDTSPSAIEASMNITIPALIIAGSKDKVTRPDKHQLPMYLNMPGTDKTYINIHGGSHCQMAMKNFRCKLAEFMILNRATIKMDAQHRILERYIVPWLRFQLLEDYSAGKMFNKMGSDDPEVEFLQPFTGH